MKKLLQKIKDYFFLNSSNYVDNRALFYSCKHCHLPLILHDSDTNHKFHQISALDLTGKDVYAFFTYLMLDKAYYRIKPKETDEYWYVFPVNIKNNNRTLYLKEKSYYLLADIQTAIRNNEMETLSDSEIDYYLNFIE
jgi:hypothetical protein